MTQPPRRSAAGEKSKTSIPMPAAFTTACHRTYSSLMNALARSGPNPDIGSNPAALNVSPKSLSAKAACVTSFNRSTTVFGRPAGPKMPKKFCDDHVGDAALEAVGISGNAG